MGNVRRSSLPRACPVLIAAALVLGGSAAVRAEAAITGVRPSTLAPGAETTIVLAGRGLGGAVRLASSRPSLPIRTGTVEAHQMLATIALPADAALGPLAIWPALEDGPAPPQIVLVDDLPAVTDNAANHAGDGPQRLPALACVDGASDAGQSDFYSVTVEAGERLACEVLTLAIRSKMDPVVRLLDASGAVLASCDDGPAGPECRFSHVFAKAGEYRFEVRDSSYRGGLAYHLRIGDFPIVSHALPLAVRRGTTTRVAFGGLDAAAVTAVDVTPPGDLADAAMMVAARMPGGRSSSWVPVLVRSESQFVEAVPPPGAAATIPVGISGRLATPGERDGHRLVASKGQKVRLTARGRSLGCGTVPRMRLVDAAGKLLAETAVTDADEPMLEATFPADGEYRLEVDDLARRGGPDYGYFVAVEPAPGFAVGLKPAPVTKDAFAVEPGHGCGPIDLVVARSGYDGEIAVSLAGGPPGLRIVNPVIAARAKEARVRLVTDQDWSERSLAVVRLTACPLGQPELRVPVGTAALRRLQEPHVPSPPAWSEGVVAVAGVRSGTVPFAITPAAPVLLTRGTDAHQITLGVRRIDPAFTGGVTIFGADLPAGLWATSRMDKDVCHVTITGSLTAAAEPSSLRLLAEADHRNRTLLVPLVVPVEWRDATAATFPRDVRPAARGQPRLDVQPPAVVLDGGRDRQQLAVTAVDAEGFPRDRTRAARITITNPAVATVRGTTLVPVGDGSTEAVIETDGLRRAVAVMVKNQGTARPVQFENEVMVALSKQTCSSGACHGSPSGKGGFRLSLRAFDRQLDELTLLREEFGRRVNPLEPDASLLLRKPLMQLPHGGGRQLVFGEETHAILRAWIAEGAKTDPPHTPRCVRLEVAPAGRQVQRLEDGGRQIVATAHFADGSRRDVTHLAAYESSATSVATVDARGWVAPRRRGETVILVRYLEHIDLVPLMFVEPVAGSAWRPPEENNYVDTLVNRKLRDLGYPPSETCTDAEFIRRVHLDVIGILPTPEETEAFLADPSVDKRAKLIDRLLERDEYARFQALAWGDLLRMSRKFAGDDGVFKYHRWLEDSFARNKPYDQFARELLLGSGSTNENPPATFYRTVADMNDTVETVAQVFLGVRLQCAKCHNHPFDRWSQDNYYGLGAFFERVRRRKTQLPGESFIYVASGGETTQPRTGKTVKPWLPGIGDVDSPGDADRRAAFADWLVSRGNPFFARVEANRIWSRFFARGIVDPVDEFRDSNPPSNVPLLDALAQDFSGAGFDRRRLMRTILNSRTYQASCRPNRENRDDTLYCSHQQPRLLTAEQLLDAIDQVTGVTQPFGVLPAGTKATQLPAPDIVKMDFLATFGQPMRDTVCACERAEESSLGMAIELFNGETVHARLVDPKNRFRTALAAGSPVETVIRRLYLAALCRQPDEDELRAALDRCAAAQDPASGVEDVCWALLNSDEFVFQH